MKQNFNLTTLFTHEFYLTKFDGVIVENLVGGAGVGFPIDSRRIEEIERA